MAQLKDQVVLVTGCSSGIGLSLIRELKRLGHRPIATARRQTSVEELDEQGFDALELDVGSAESVNRAVAQAIERFGRIDVVINNAGFNLFGPVMEVSLTDLERLFDTNVLGVLRVSQAVFPHLAERRSGRIVNIGSVVGVLPTPFAAGYSATKSAVHTLSDVMRQELAPLGIDVVVVQPGGVRSSIADNAAASVERFADPSSRYHALLEQIRRRAYASQAAPMEADAFARKVIKAALARRAPRRVREGRGALALPALAKLPAPLLDRIMGLQSGLSRLR